MPTSGFGPFQTSEHPEGMTIEQLIDRLKEYSSLWIFEGHTKVPLTVFVETTEGDLVVANPIVGGRKAESLPNHEMTGFLTQAIQQMFVRMDAKAYCILYSAWFCIRNLDGVSKLEQIPADDRMEHVVIATCRKGEKPKIYAAEVGLKKGGRFTKDWQEIPVFEGMLILETW